MSKTVRIFSADNRFSRMLELELSSLEFNVVINDSINEDSLNNEICSVVDLDSINVSELRGIEKSELLIFFSKNEKRNFKFKLSNKQVFFKRPFSMSDFLDVFKNAKKNEQSKSKSSDVRKSKPMIINVSETDRSALWGDLKIPLSESEFKVLYLLCKNRGNVVYRDAINTVLGAIDGNIGDVYICHLRQKIDNMLGIKLIYTIRGMGYLLKN